MSSCNTGSLRKSEVLCSKYMLLIRGNQEAGDKYVCVSSIRSENCASTSWLSGAFTAKSTRTWFKISGISFIPLQNQKKLLQTILWESMKTQKVRVQMLWISGSLGKDEKTSELHLKMDCEPWYEHQVVSEQRVWKYKSEITTASAELLLSLVQKEWRHKVTI